MGADTAEELIQKGDGCSARFQSAEALKYFLPAQKLDPNNARLMVRIAQHYRHLMSDASKREEKVTLGTVAVACALRALFVAAFVNVEQAREHEEGDLLNHGEWIGDAACPKFCPEFIDLAF